jgi:plasmid stabilization system protein ParE
VPAAPADRRLRLLRQAEAELNKAADEYDEARPGLRDRFVSAVDTAIESILAAPHRWPLVDRRHHRVLVRRFPFSIVYRFDDTEIIVVAIAHHRRRPGYWSRRR